MCLPEEEESEEKHGQKFNGLGLIFIFWCFSLTLFGILCSFHNIFSAVKLKVKLRTEFPNAWGEYKIPIIIILS